MKPWENVETLVVGPLGTLLAFVKRQIGQGSFNSGEILWETFHESFSCYSFYSGDRDMKKTLTNKLREIYF